MVSPFCLRHVLDGFWKSSSEGLGQEERGERTGNRQRPQSDVRKVFRVVTCGWETDSGREAGLDLNSRDGVLTELEQERSHAGSHSGEGGAGSDGGASDARGVDL